MTIIQFYATTAAVILGNLVTAAIVWFAIVETKHDRGEAGPLYRRTWFQAVFALIGFGIFGVGIYAVTSQ